MSSDKSEEFQTALQSNLSSDEAVSVPSAVKAFTDPIATAWHSTASASDIEEQLWTAWGTAIKFAASSPDDQQDGITQLMKETWKLGPLQKSSGEVCRIEDKTVWTDLPVFGQAMREAWNPDPKDAASWRNKNAFAARLTNLESKESPLDFGLYGIWSNRSALESKAAASEDWASIAAIDLEASCMWFVYASQALLRFTNDEKSFDGKVAKAGEGYGDKEWKGFCVDRWSAWKSTLQALQDSGAKSEQSDLLQAALAAIKYAEENS